MVLGHCQSSVALLKFLFCFLFGDWLVDLLYRWLFSGVVNICVVVLVTRQWLVDDSADGGLR